MSSDHAPCSGGNPVISVVIPVYNEARGLAACLHETTRTLLQAGIHHEIVFVDDGSTDGSGDILRSFTRRHRQVTLIQFRRNCGQQKALFAGLRHAKGEVVVTFDADLQCPPQSIVLLANKLLEGYDIVSGTRTHRKDSRFYNRIPSYFGRLLINRALDIRQTDFGGPKAYSRRIVNELMKFPGEFIVIPAAAYAISKNFTEVPVAHTNRREGASKWSVWMRMETYFDIYVSYAKRPFQFFMLAGFGSMCIGLALGSLIVLYKLITRVQFAGTIIFFDFFLIFTGLLLFIISIMGEFLMRIFRSQNHIAAGNIDNIIFSQSGYEERTEAGFADKSN